MSSGAEWKELGEPPPNALAAARMQLHHASQIVAAVGTTLATPSPDFGHTNLGWSVELDALVGRPVGRGVAAGLRPADFTLLLVEGDRVLAEMPCPGLTLEKGLAWLKDALDGVTLVRPSHDMPEHALSDGATFAEATPAFAEIGRWLANASGVLGAAAVAEGGSEVRCWPHHFDIATSITLDDDRPAEEARSIGAGMALGDRSYSDPYFYVTPWPYPKDPARPQLAAGAWHEQGWTGAVLTAESLVAGGTAEQRHLALRFVSSAVTGCRALLSL